MLKTTFSDLPSPTRILAIGCHSDDIEIGCGGTILTLIESLPSVEVCWVVLSASGERAERGAQERRGISRRRGGQEGRSFTTIGTAFFPMSAAR